MVAVGSRRGQRFVRPVALPYPGYGRCGYLHLPSRVPRVTQGSVKISKRTAVKAGALILLWVGLVFTLAFLESHPASVSYGGIEAASAATIAIALIGGRLTDAVVDAIVSDTPSLELIPLDSVLSERLDDIRFVNRVHARMLRPSEPGGGGRISGLFGIVRAVARGGPLINCHASLRVQVRLPTSDAKTGTSGFKDLWVDAGNLPWHSPSKLPQALDDPGFDLFRLGRLLANPRETIHPGQPQTLILCFLGHDQQTVILCGDSLGSGVPSFNPGKEAVFVAEIAVSADNLSPVKRWFVVTGSRNSIKIRASADPSTLAQSPLEGHIS
jgi:hypothetical protein